MHVFIVPTVIACSICKGSI